MPDTQQTLDGLDRMLEKRCLSAKIPGMALIASQDGERIFQIMYCFFFHAEDVIRDYKVTGVQTCALPISFDVDPAVVRTYFSFDKVRAGIFSLTEDLFEVQIRPWATEVWSPEVKAYELVEKGKVIGRFYLDMHPRDNKYTHAAMFPIRVGIKGRALPVRSEERRVGSECMALRAERQVT